MINTYRQITTVLFLLLDGVATFAMFLQSSLTAVMLVLAIASSATVALLSSTLKSLLWPDYFWDESETASASAPRQRTASAQRR
jgi:hypothetical protein